MFLNQQHYSILSDEMAPAGKAVIKKKKAKTTNFKRIIINPFESAKPVFVKSQRCS